MAEVLSVDQLLANSAEPLRQFRFILSIEGIEAWTILTSKLPGGEFGKVEIPFLNTKRFFAGKFTPNELPIKLWQPISPSAAQKVNDWIRLNFEAQTGRMGYKDFYAKDITIKLLDPPGGVAQQWTLKNCWPKSVDNGTLDYSNEGMVEIDITLVYDNYILNF